MREGFEGEHRSPARSRIEASGAAVQYAPAVGGFSAAKDRMAADLPHSTPLGSRFGQSRASSRAQEADKRHNG